jgi:hypothetical protein
MKTSRAALLALVAVSIVPAPALACGGAIVMRHFQAPKEQAPPPPVLVADAEKKLEKGEHVAAAVAAVRAFPKIKAGAAAAGLEGRALRVAALATVRSDGAVGPGGAKAPSSEARERNLAWSAAALKGLDAKADAERGGDPSLKANVGEALARLAPARDEAFRTLKDLADRDLMGSPHAYAALARLATERGDEALARTARGRCETMGGAGATCGGVGGEGGDKVVRASFAPAGSKVARASAPVAARR